MLTDDLVAVLAPPPASGGTAVGFRQGIVRAWDPATAANTVEVGGATLTNLPCLNASEALLLQPGDVVSVLTAGSSWFVLGRIVIPGQVQAAAYGVGLVHAVTVGNISISSATYVAHATGPSVSTRVYGSGKVIATVGATIDADVSEGLAVAVYGTGPDGATYGPSSPPLQLQNVITGSGLGGTINASMSCSTELSGLTPGLWTFELRYRKLAGSFDPTVSARTLTIAPY